MTMATTDAHCFDCSEEEVLYDCRGCSKTFCFDHLTTHREIINQQFNQFADHCNSVRQTIIDQKNEPKYRPLIEQIDQWESDSVNKIKQTADQCRQNLVKYTNESIIGIEYKLNDLSEQLKPTRKGNQFNEIHVNQLNQNLEKLKKQLEKSPYVSIKQESTSFINKICVITSFGKDAKWKQQACTIAGGNNQGNQLNQLNHPQGIFIDDHQNIYIADQGNDRIVEWKYNATNGQIIAGGDQTEYQLKNPTDVILDRENDSFIIADQGNRRVIRWSRQNNTNNGQIIIEDIDCYGLTMDKNGSLYVSDSKKNEVRRWKREETDGTIVAGGNGQGDHLNQLNGPRFIFVDDDHSLYVTDWRNHRVMKWMKDAKEGIVVAGGNGQGNSLTQLPSPQGMMVDQLGQIYVADYSNARVTRWCGGAEEGTLVVGGNGKGQQSNQFNGPSGLSFDREGNLYAVDWGIIESKDLKLIKMKRRFVKLNKSKICNDNLF